MNRRSLLQSIASGAVWTAPAHSAASPQTPGRKTKFYQLEYFYLRQGDQGDRINRFLSSQMPLLTRNKRPVGVFTALIGSHLPLTLALTGYASWEDMESSDDYNIKDPDFRAALQQMENGPEPAYDSLERTLLRATDFSPEIEPPTDKPKSPRVFELRLYHSPTARQMRVAATMLQIFTPTYYTQS